MKKLLIFMACLLCLTLCIVACGKNKGEGSESTEAGSGDIDWSDVVGGSDDATGGIDGPVHTFEVDEDKDEGWGPLQPF